jgi:hypothetical protein
MPNVHASPSDQAPTHHVVLELGGQKWGLKLDRGSKGYSIDERTTESSFGAVFSRTGKKYGNDPSLTLLEQREWTDGRGVRNYEDSAAGYFDAEAAWTLTAGYVLPCPQWKRATVNRVANGTAPGSVMWKDLFGDSLNVSVSYTATAMTATHIKLWIRRVGSPGTLSCTIASDSTGDPGAVIQTVTKTVSDVTDYVSSEINFTINQALTALTYHVYVTGAATDNNTNHWEVGCNDAGTGSKISSDGSTWSTPSNTFAMYYRVTPADIAQRHWFFTMNGVWYAVTSPDTGTSQLFSFATTGIATEITGHGFHKVTGRPVISDDFCYFPMGESENIRRWDGATTWADDGTNMASMLALGYDAADGPQVWKVNNAAAATTVARAKAVGSGNLTFRTAINCGEYSYPITSVLWTDSGLQVFKENGAGVVSNDRYTKLSSGMEMTPSARNGQASIYWNSVLYFSWLNTWLRKYGGNAEDVGQAWKGRGLPGSRQGAIASAALDSARMFLAMDAGTGTSSVQVYNGLTWMEIFRCPQAGYRVRDVAVQPVEDGQPRVWIDAGGDIFYFDMPKDVASPLYDSSMLYQHEFVVVSPTFDDSAARLSKYIREFTVASSNLNGSTIRIEFDYQTDENIGGSAWVYAGNLLSSPEDTIKLHLGNIRAFRFRLRCLTDAVATPPVIEATVIDGFTRTPNRPIWNLRVVVGGKTLAGGQDHKAEALLAFLRNASQYPGAMRMQSVFPELHNKQVIVSPPSVYREVVNKILRIWKGSITVSLMNMD